MDTSEGDPIIGLHLLYDMLLMQKNLDYIATPQSGRPPRAPGNDVETPEASAASEPSIREIATTAVRWENPLLSGILTTGGLLIAILGDYLLKGKHGVPLLSGTFCVSEYPIFYHIITDFLFDLVKKIQFSCICHCKLHSVKIWAMNGL